MNKLITNDFFNKSERQEILKMVMSLPYGNHTRLEDAQVKWVGIIDVYNILNINASTLLDVGCGSSPLSIFFKQCKNINTVYALDIVSDTTNFQHIIDGGCKYICNNIINDTIIADNSLDVVVDSCAITCGTPNTYDAVFSKISILLKTGGYFITVCDTLLTSKSGNFIHPLVFIDICKKYNLELVDEYTEVTSDLFISKKNYCSDGDLNVVRLVFKKV